MKKFAFLSDLFFTFLVSSLLSLCFFRFLRVSVFPSIGLALLCGILITLAIGAVLQAKRKTLHLKKSDEVQKQKLLFHFAMLSDSSLTEFFRVFLTQKTDLGEIRKRSPLHLQSEKGLFFLSFRLSPVNADEILKIARIKTPREKNLFCSQITEDALALCHRFSISVKRGEEIYLLLKKADALPQQYLGEETPQIRRKQKFRLWFSKHNAKRFLVGGGFILLASLATPFFYYYLLLGCLLLFTAIFVRIFGYEN